MELGSKGEGHGSGAVVRHGEDRALLSGHLYRGLQGLSRTAHLDRDVGDWGFGLSGLPLAVVVLMAALPTGSNALIFAQRYDTGATEATAAIVVTTLLFVLSASAWLGVLALFG